MTLKNLEKSILQLPPIQRIHMIERIVESLNVPDQKIEKLWASESEKRYTAFKSGKMKSISLQALKKRLGQ